MENGKQIGVTATQTARKSSRKQWILHDGPNGSLHRLRARMAEEGCIDSQLALAQQLLQENTNESDQLAVHWLLRAAEQGQEEALNLLRTCLETRKGITEQSYLEVRACLSRPFVERSARNAARNLFSNLAHGSDFLSAYQLEDVLLPSSSPNLPAPADDVGNESVDQTVRQVAPPMGGELISEQHLVSAASMYADGHLPPFRFGLASKRSLRDHFISTVTSTKFLLLFLTTMGGVCFFFQSESSLFLCCAITMLMIAAGIAITATVKTCQLQRDWEYFQSWSRLLQTHARDLQPYVPEGQFLRRFYPPHYSRFFMALVPCVILPPILRQISPLALPYQSGFMADPYGGLPFGELALVAFLMCSLCWPAFTTTWAFIRPVDEFLCGLGWVLLRSDINKALWDEEEGEPGSWMYQFSHILVQLSVFSIMGAILVSVSYIRQLRRFDNAQSLVAWLVPHISSLAWLWLGIDWFRQATWAGLVRGIIGIVVCAIWPVLTWPQVALIALVSSTHLLVFNGPAYLAVVEVCIVLLVYVKTKPYLVKATDMGRSLVTSSPRIVTAFAVALFAVLLVTWQLYDGVNDVTTTTTPRESQVDDADEVLRSPEFEFTKGFADFVDQTEIPVKVEETADVEFRWQDYRNFCHEPAWESSSMARTQLLCASLGGLVVQWEGIVKQVQIMERRNWLESILNWMPVGVANWVACRYGETWDECHEKSDWNDVERRRCQVLGSVAQEHGYGCHLNQWTKLKLLIEIVPAGRFWESKMAFFLRADSNLQEVVLQLQPDDRILFTGKLIGPTLGGTKPEMELVDVLCQVCKAGNLDSSQFEKVNLAENFVAFGGKHILTSAQALMDFMLTPFLRVNVTRIFSN